MGNHKNLAVKYMTSHNIDVALSEAEEMYLITIASLAGDTSKVPVPLSALAQELDIQPVSVNQMVRKLAEAAWVDYLPYKGVALTTVGRMAARRVLRFRRLWEVFLVQHLRMPEAEADALACRMEHITTRDVAERLARFLGNPVVSPQGKPIPTLNGEGEPSTLLPLDQLQVGQRGQVVQMEVDSMVRSFLSSQGIRPGVGVSILALGADGAVLLEAGGQPVHLAGQVVAGVVVRQLESV